MSWQVTSRKVYSQIINGESFGSNPTDYSTNLIGSIMERVQIISEAVLSLISLATAAADEFIISGLNTITRSGTSTGDFTADGWIVGDQFDYNSVGSGVTFNGTIVTVSATVITFTVNTGAAANGTHSDATMYGTTDYDAAVFQFGLIENTEPTNYTNKVDGSGQMFQLNGITGGYQTMLPVAGAKSWITGDCEIMRAAIASGVYTFTIKHEFIILPYDTVDLEPYLTSGTLPPDLFDGVQSLKYVFDLRVREALSNPNQEQAVIDSNNLGSVGWFGENYNGFSNHYAAVIDEYIDTTDNVVVTAVQIDRKTTVRGTITGTNGTFDANTYIGIYVSAILDSSQYAANTTLYKELWNYDNAVKQVGTTSTPAGIITRITSTLVGVDEITFEIDIEFDTDQQALLAAGQSFLIAAQTCDNTLSQTLSDKVMIVAGISELIEDSDVDDLLEWDSAEVLFHPNNEHDFGSSNSRLWNEDGIFNRFRFNLNNTKGAILKALTLKYLARDTSGNEFTIQEVPFDLSSGVLVPIGGGLYKQAFNLDATRGFQLPAGDFFNRIRLGEFTDTNPMRWGEETLNAGMNTITFTSAFLDANYSIVVIDMDGIGLDLENISQTAGGFEITALSGPGNIAYLAVYNTIPAAFLVQAAATSLIAGNNTVTFATPFTSTGYIVMPLDVSGVGVAMESIVKSLGSFTIDSLAVGLFNYVAIMDSFVNYVRAGSQAVAGAGLQTIVFSTPLADTDYTLLAKDMETYANISPITKTVTGFTYDSLGAGQINYIAILNL